MKRLLNPLIAALALPTSFNANWLSGDIVETNVRVEKTIIKKELSDLKKIKLMIVLKAFNIFEI